MSRPPTEPPPGRRPEGSSGGPGGPGTPPPKSGASWVKFLPWLLVALLVLVFFIPNLSNRSSGAKELTYSQFVKKVEAGQVEKVTYNKSNGNIDGDFLGTVDGAETFTTDGPNDDLPESTLELLKDQGVTLVYTSDQPNLLLDSILPLMLPILVIVGLFVWMMRRGASQASGLMSIGRSRAKVYSTEKPKTLFDDVAGYGPVKAEIAEVVDFLKHPAKFKDIGARIPKGVLLVGPPGTGKTLIARAVAGEAGVPFVSVTGSDFMEMFVGVGAARVRDLFQTARKQAPAIIFIDEIDSIGRKRGAGLGGGHDEREQTLNQMLAEMDGFEATEGIVVMAATNRPDVLDPALLRPGRFDRQIVVPLPTQDERSAILRVHLKNKQVSEDVDIDIIARGTPGMSGADLANLVNEAALFAVRRGATLVHAEDFEAARDRVLMGLKRESMALTEEEKEVVAYHEGGHAILAYVLDNADPVHKVTILPTGMALGVTQQLPVEERHIYKQEYITDSIGVALGGRLAEELVFGHFSTGAQNDLVRVTELARKMAREWGMSERIGPMAWGGQGPVFLGEDLMHTRDYSDETARVIDEEVERILRQEEARSRKILEEHRAGLDAIARALLEHETIDGTEVGRLVDEAMGRKAGGFRRIRHADGTVTEVRPGDAEVPPLIEPEGSVLEGTRSRFGDAPR